MPYIGNHPNVTDDVTTKSVDALTDVDTVSDAPEVGQVLKWNGNSWVPEDDTGTGGGGGGATTSDLQGVTDNGSSTTNVIDAPGFKLNSDQLSSVAGTEGDIKKIGGLPYYHNGTSWKRFYLLDNVEDTTTVDINWEDVQVRFDFEDDGSGGTQAFTNYVNKLKINSTGTGGITTVNSPVKFGTSSLKLNQTTQFGAWTENYLEGYFIDREIVQATDGGYSSGKRGGCIDWTQDWTIETWVYFPSGLTNLRHPLICAQDGTAAGQGIYFDIPRLNEAGYGNVYLYWGNGNLNTSSNSQPLAWWPNTQDTWIHVAVSFRASDATLHSHINGTYRNKNWGSGIIWYAPPVDLNIHSNAGGFTWLGAYRSDGYFDGTSEAIYIDDLRITQAFRYGSNSSGGTITDFTAPTAAYPIAPPPPATIDPDWNNVKLRATFDTNLNDIGPNTLTGSVTNGNPIIQGPVKYGTGAAFPLVSTSNNDGIQWTSGDYSFLTGPWTFESWVKFNDFPLWNNIPTGVKQQVLWSYGSNSGQTANNIEFGVMVNAPNNYSFYWRDSDGIVALSAVNDFFSLDDIKRWQHIALTKNSNNELLLFVNGYALRDDNLDTDLTTGRQISTLTLNTSGEFSLGGRVGNYTFSTSTTDSEIYFDDFRFSNKVRYTETFSPPTGQLATTGTLTSSPTPASDGEGSITLGGTPIWTGTTGWTVSRITAGSYRVTFPGSFSTPESYVVHTTINNGPSSPCYVRVVRSTQYFDVIVSLISDSSAVDTGYVAVRLVDLSDV